MDPQTQELLIDLGREITWYVYTKNRERCDLCGQAKLRTDSGLKCLQHGPIIPLMVGLAAWRDAANPNEIEGENFIIRMIEQNIRDYQAIMNNGLPVKPKRARQTWILCLALHMHREPSKDLWDHYKHMARWFVKTYKGDSSKIRYSESDINEKNEFIAALESELTNRPTVTPEQ